jgi:hypothetical protein
MCGARVASVRTVDLFCRGPQHLLALYLLDQINPLFWSTAHIAVSLRPYEKLAFVRALWRSYARYQKIVALYIPSPCASDTVLAVDKTCYGSETCLVNKGIDHQLTSK